MYPTNKASFRLIRSTSGSDGLPEKEQHVMAPKNLAGVLDWVSLCQRCASSETQVGTGDRPTCAQSYRAVVVPLKIRRDT